MMSRAEHLAWCKERALAYLAHGQINEALTSMMSDMSKHPELANPGLDALTAQLMMIGSLSTVTAARKHIEGYN